jgi:hypothetical protein
MVKRVARAIGKADHLDEIIPDDLEPIARAAIAAMREPTEAMLTAAADWSRRKYGSPIGNDAATGCWHVMIDAILRDDGAASKAKADLAGLGT